MNAKRAKQLRKQAARETVGMPYEQYLRSKQTNMIVLNPSTTKGRYHQLKKKG